MSKRRLRHVLACFAFAMMFTLLVNPQTFFCSRAGEISDEEITEEITAETTEKVTQITEEVAEITEEVTETTKSEQAKQEETLSSTPTEYIQADSKKEQGGQTQTKTYLFDKNVKDSVALGELLPSDCGQVTYQIKAIDDPEGLLLQNKLSKDGVLAYHLHANRSGQVMVVITASSENYVDVDLTFYICSILGGEEVEEEEPNLPEPEPPVITQDDEEEEIIIPEKPEESVSGNDIRPIVNPEPSDPSQEETEKEQPAEEKKEEQSAAKQEVREPSEEKNENQNENQKEEQGPQEERMPVIIEDEPVALAGDIPVDYAAIAGTDVLGAIRAVEVHKEQEPVFVAHGEKDRTKTTDKWEALLNRNNGETITIDMAGDTVVPGSVLKLIAGRDIILILDMGDGVSWMIDGKTFDGNWNDSIDFGMCFDAGEIPQDQVESIAKGDKTQTISLNHDGPFGFDVLLTLPFEKEEEGLIANLFYFNPQTEKLQFVAANRINENGCAAFLFEHASDYVVIKSEISLGLNQEEKIKSIYGRVEEGKLKPRVAEETALTTVEAKNPFWYLLLGFLFISGLLFIYFTIASERVHDSEH